MLQDRRDFYRLDYGKGEGIGDGRRLEDKRQIGD
jgi:hypothetical protein